MNENENKLRNEIEKKIKEIQTQLEKLKIEGYNTKKEESTLKQNTPDVNLPYDLETLESMLNELKELELKLEEQNIYNQIKKSMNHLEEALEYETDINSELKAYVSICELALKELESGLSVMTEEMASEIYGTIYKILKVQLADGGSTLFDTIKNNENNKKYINELIRKDILFLINAPFIKSKELVELNKAVARAEVNTDEERRLVDLEVINSVVKCYNSSERRTLVRETIANKIERINKLHEDSQSKQRGIDTQIDNEDKVITKKEKVESQRKIKLIASALTALLTITSACGITINVNKAEKLTISNYLEALLPISGIGAFSTLAFSGYKDKKMREILNLELSSIRKSLEELNSDLLSDSYTGLTEIEELGLLYDFMISTSSYSTLTDEERTLLEETTSTSLKKDYFEYIKTNRRY